MRSAPSGVGSRFLRDRCCFLFALPAASSTLEVRLALLPRDFDALRVWSAFGCDSAPSVTSIVSSTVGGWIGGGVMTWDGEGVGRVDVFDDS